MALFPLESGRPFIAAWRSFRINGTPRSGIAELVGRLRAISRALSNQVKVSALIAGLSCSARSIAASRSSTGVTFPDRTSSAWSTASTHCVSCASDDIAVPPNWLGFTTCEQFRTQPATYCPRRTQVFIGSSHAYLQLCLLRRRDAAGSDTW